MRRLWMVCLLATACERNVKPAPTKAEPAPAPPAVVPKTDDGFGDWVRITPTRERFACANHSDEEWQVYLDANNTVAARRPAQREPNTGPDLPFALPKADGTRGRRHILKVVDGYLAGFDAGEWGGSLYWFSSDGKQQRELAKENVDGLLALDNDNAIAFEGLAHLGLDDGRARWLTRDAKQTAWRETSTVALDGATRAFVQNGDSIYVITTKSLTRVTRDKQVKVIQKLPEGMSSLYPDSMIADPNGRLFVGMRQLVLRLVPKNGAYELEWFAPKGCAEAVVNDYNCICTK